MSTDAAGARAVPRAYLDSASGMPLHPAAREVWEAAVAQGWADPLTPHTEGRTARMLLENARSVIAEILHCDTDEVSFTGSGTAACQLGVLGLRRGRRRHGRAVVHSAVEHSAVLNAAAWDGGDEAPSDAPPPDAALVGSVPVDAFGAVDVDAWTEAVGRPGVALACLQSANPLVGTVQPLEAAWRACQRQDVPLFVDAAASIGWAKPPEKYDVLAASAHKWGGPAGVGVLVVRRSARWRSPLPDDERQPGVSGFADAAGAMAAAAALQAVEAERVVHEAALRRMTDELRREIQQSVPDVDVAGHPDDRLPHIVNFSCLYVDGEALVGELDRRGFAVSSGSASTGPASEPSHVLGAMGMLAHGNVRVSVSPQTSPEEVWRLVDATADIVPRLRGAAGVSSVLAGGGRHRGEGAGSVD